MRNTAISSLRGTISAIAICAMWVVATPAAAQQSDQAGEAVDSVDTPPSNGNEEIVVTATGTNISNVKPVGNTAVVVTADDAVKSGYSTPAEVLRTLPQVRVGEFDIEGGRSTISLQNAGGANSVSLRGLGGSSSTLILIDGRRVVPVGTNTSATEANQVPLAALKRIEIIADGASAVYGSDAVAGVINYIIRRDYKGAEVTFRGNNNNGGAEYGLDATLGTTWETGLGRGNILVSYGYTHRDAVNAGKNPWLRFDGRAAGGIDRRLNGAAATTGFIPNITRDAGAGNLNTTLPAAGTTVYYGLPDGSNVGLSAGQLRLNDPNLTEYAYFTDFLGRQNRHQAALFFNQELGSSVELFVQANYLNRKTLTRSPEAVGSGATFQLKPFILSPAGIPTATPNPYYISGIPGFAPGAPLTVQYPALKDFGAKIYSGSDESYNISAGLRVNLPGNWKGEAFYTFGRSEGCGYCVTNGYLNPVAYQYQVDIGAINPLSSLPLTAAQAATVTGKQTQIGYNGIDDAVIKFDGPLFALPAGSVKAAFGGEYLKQFNYNENTSVAGTNNAVTVLTDRGNSYYGRTIKSAFGELYVPLVSEDMGVTLVKSLTFTAAVRYDDYSDGGNTTNPKFGATWEVADFLALSGTWGTSYVSPSITDKNPSAYVSGLVFPLLPQTNPDPRFQLCAFPGLCFPFAQNTAVLFGSNPDLRPQTSKNWTLSAELKPGGGFRAGVNYYNIDYKDRIVFPNSLGEFLVGPTVGSNPPSYRGYEQYIIPINNPSTCSNSDLSTADPVLQNLLSRPIYGASSGVGALASFPNFCGIRSFVDSRFTNLGRSQMDGLDMDVSWTGKTGEVTLNVGAAANVILHNKETVGPGAPTITRLNTQNSPIKWRGRGNLTAMYRGFSTTLFANYQGAWTNTEHQTAPQTPFVQLKIPAYTTFDLNLTYSTDFEGRANRLFKGLRASITIQNLFDRDPQTVVGGTGGTSYVAGRSSLWGRTMSFQITGSF